MPGKSRVISMPIINIFLILISLSPIVAKAQSSGGTTGSIFGSIKDEQGAAISGASITIKSLQTNTQNSIYSDDQGSYQLFQLRPGNYEVTAQANGFVSQAVIARLYVGIISVNNFVLSVDQTRDVVEIKDNSVNAVNTESSTNITAERIETLPINRRNFLDFSLTAARVTPDRLPAQGHGNTSGLSFNGQSPRQNIINVDGHDNNDYSSGTVRATFSQEAVQEYQIISDGYSAEFGRALGGVVNIITKSGTNQFHGATFLFFRNASTSARNAFLSIKPPFEQYQFGATFSGPIKQDRAFFFASFERLTVKQNNVVTIADNTIRSVNNIGFNERNGAIPVSLGTSTGLVRLDFYQHNNRTNLRFNTSGRYNGSYEPFGGLVAGSVGGALQLTENSIAVSNTHNSGSGSFINETRFLYNHRNLDIVPLEEGPQIQIIAPEGLVALRRSIVLPQRTDSNLFQFSNITSIIKQTQQIKFGGDLLYNFVKARFPVTESGIAIFAPFALPNPGGDASSSSFNGLQALDPSLRTAAQQAFLSQFSSVLPTIFPGYPKLNLANLSLPVFYQQGFPEKSLVPTRPLILGLFLQDDIKVNSQLLVKVGIRYDYTHSSFVPDTGGNLSPRLALAYSPHFNQNLRMHAAYGLFFAAPTIGDIEVVVMPNSAPNFFMPFPFSIQAFMQPARRFQSVSEIPTNIPRTPQFSVFPQFQPNLRASYTQQINAGVDYLVKNRFKVALDYSFVRGYKLLRSRDINPIVNPVANNAIASFTTGRLNPNSGSIVYFESAADSYYHGFSASVAGQITKGINLLAHYTFSKGIDNFLDYNPTIPGINPIDPLNPGRERSLSLQDVRSRFVLSGSWDLGRTRNLLLKNLSISSIVTLESGRPYNLLAGGDLDMNGDFPPSDRPLGIGRNAGITPGFANVDLRLTRTFAVKESVKITATIEAFNLFNRVNISEIDFTFPPDAKGNFHLPEQHGGRFIAPPARYRNAFAPRQLQFGLKVNF